MSSGSRAVRVAASLKLQLVEVDQLEYHYDPSSALHTMRVDYPGWPLERLSAVAETSGEGLVSASDVPTPTVEYLFTWPALALTMRVSCPRGYPAAAKIPQITLECPSFETEYSHDSLHAMLQSIAESAAKERAAERRLCVDALLECCCENAADFVAVSVADGAVAGEEEVPPSSSTMRAFISFHHMLLGKEHKKEKAVVTAAKQMRLSGFIVYGKPSCICLEFPGGGSCDEVADFLRAANSAGKSGSVSLLHYAVRRADSAERRADLAVGEAAKARFVVASALCYDDVGDQQSARCANNGKAGLQVVKPLGKKGETPDIAALTDLFLRPMGLEEHARTVLGSSDGR